MHIIKNSMILVTIQFVIILILLLINESILNKYTSLLISSIGFIFGLYTLFFNRVGNFNVRPEIKSNAKLISNGAYKYIRHPMYFSVLLIMLGVIITDINLTNVICYSVLIIVLYLKAKKEEMLWNEKLEEYASYKEKTKMFIPFIL
jgi:protein-S-isoprenylcysteine O-methyltransferase Ste14